jgi:hypothetical protein
MSLRVEILPGDETQQAAMYGPLVLAGRLGGSDLNKSETYIGYKTSPGGEPVPTPEIQAGHDGNAKWLEPVSSQTLTFQTVGQDKPTELVPLYKLHGEHYVVYWKVNSGMRQRMG